MPLAFQDFWPRATPLRRAPGGLAWEPLPSVVARASQWLAESGLRPLNVETLVLPASGRQSPDPAAGGGAARWDEDQAWMQVVRVWYEKTPAAPPAPQPGPPPMPVTGAPWPPPIATGG